MRIEETFKSAPKIIGRPKIDPSINRDKVAALRKQLRSLGVTLAPLRDRKQ
jgi:hypothetical protein